MDTRTKVTISPNSSESESSFDQLKTKKQELKDLIADQTRKVSVHYNKLLNVHNSIMRIKPHLPMHRQISFEMIELLNTHITDIAKELHYETGDSLSYEKDIDDSLLKRHKDFLSSILEKSRSRQDIINNPFESPATYEDQKENVINLKDITDRKPLDIIEKKEFTELQLTTLCMKNLRPIALTLLLKGERPDIFFDDGYSIYIPSSDNNPRINRISLPRVKNERIDTIHLNRHMKYLPNANWINSRKNDKNMCFIRDSIDASLRVIMNNIDSTIKFIAFANNEINEYNMELSTIKTCIEDLNETKSQLEILTKIKADSTAIIDQPMKPYDVNTSLSTNDAKTTLNNDHVEQIDTETMKID